MTINGFFSVVSDGFQGDTDIARMWDSNVQCTIHQVFFHCRI